MDLSIIVVYYKARDEIRACLPTLLPGCEGLEYEVLVVDNASQDDVAREIRGLNPEVRVLENSENFGFAQAVNRGLAEARGRFFALLNPDTRVEPGALTRLVRFLEAHPDAGAVGPKLLDPDGRVQLSCRRFPNHWTGLFNRYSISTRLFPNNPWSRSYLMLDFDHASTRAVDWVSGACLVTPREVVDRIGPMDESFFLFNEDVDWCRRMHEAGYRVYYVPDAVCVHQIGASRGRVPVAVIWRRHEGMRHYVRKHHRLAWPWLALTDLGIWMRCLVQIALNPWKPRQP